MIAIQRQLLVNEDNILNWLPRLDFVIKYANRMQKVFNLLLFFVILALTLFVVLILVRMFLYILNNDLINLAKRIKNQETTHQNYVYWRKVYAMLFKHKTKIYDSVSHKRAWFYRLFLGNVDRNLYDLILVLETKLDALNPISKGTYSTVLTEKELWEMRNPAYKYLL